MFEVPAVSNLIYSYLRISPCEVIEKNLPEICTKIRFLLGLYLTGAKSGIFSCKKSVYNYSTELLQNLAPQLNLMM